MKVRNHNGAEYGMIENENGFIRFHPRKDWNSYSAYELENIASTMRKIEQEVNE